MRCSQWLEWSVQSGEDDDGDEENERGEGGEVELAEEEKRREEWVKVKVNGRVNVRVQDFS
ncbi:hypothetical protein HYFRA_00000789 [Hymenoscyphus fraxineus]|uniref:Uncharacterized protein n=1 Tax=Hymenoscyphus fraxineus TaxID=746836 RepID=A0A9N9KS91_9HELO|nr:hypothetical protein HYFRA_00000789 [Hymenoscyphus fraxineus]